MERLHLLDAEFLHLEDRSALMHIAALCVFEGEVPSDAEFRRLFEAKLHLAPRYRQRVRFVPLELGRPVWVDDPHFDFAYHVRRTALPAPGDARALNTLMGRVMEQQLDRERPLWEWWIVEGLSGGRWAVISKIHHAIVDGVSGIDLLSLMLDRDPNPKLPEPVPWTPEPEPSGAAKVLDAWDGLAHDIKSWGNRISHQLSHPREAARTVVETSQGLLALFQRMRLSGRLSIEGPLSPHRVFASASLSLDDIRVIRKVHGGTINDVVLAALTSGYRALLAAHGDDVDTAEVRTLIPVSVRKPEAASVRDNRFSGIICELPVKLKDPCLQLAAIKEATSELKRSHMAEAGEWMFDVGDLAPPMLVGPLSRLAARIGHELPQHTINTITTNVPGPQFPLYGLGRRQLACYPYVPIVHGARVGTAVLSYDGQVGIGVTGDRESVPDVQLLARATEDAIAQLLATHP